MLRKTMIVALAAAMFGLIVPHAALAGAPDGFEYGNGWGDGVVFGPGHYTRPHAIPARSLYQGYPYIGYDGPPFFFGWDDECYVMRRPGAHQRPVHVCE
jgi:hypothetical protein